MWKAFLVIGALTAAVLGWGYWHAATHAALQVSLQDVSLRNDRQAYGTVLAADLVFKDAAGTALANGRADKPLGIVSIDHPKVGDCSREERQASASRQNMDAWRRCFETKSRWMTTWIRQVRYASMDLGNCRIDQVPVSLEESKDTWWLWWIPNPHIGGLSYTYFQLTLRIDSANCRAVSP
jgi:hypothetical protein